MRNVKDILEDLYYTLEDFYLDVRLRQRKAKKKQTKRKKTMSASEYQLYQRKQLKTLGKGLAAAFGCFLVILLAAQGIRSAISAVSGRKVSDRDEEQMVSLETESEAGFQEKEITVGSTGCMLLHSPFLSSYPDAEGNYDFSSIYKYISPYYSEPDFMTCEFEGTLSGPELGYYGYPTFRSPDVIIENIRDSGVDLQMLATNHIYDSWSDGFHRTMDVYEQKGIAYTGIRKNENEKPYYIADIKGVTVGFINYVYETTGAGTNLNGIPVAQEDAALVNSFDYDNLESFYTELDQNIQSMEADGARFIIANIHWGTEYQLTESGYQDQIAQRLCDLGVDALIGGHPHCEQPIDVLSSQDGNRQMFCIYSMGNALSNQRKELISAMPTGHTEDGVMVTLTLHQDKNGTVKIADVDLLPTWVYRFQDQGSKYYILPLDDVEHLEEATGISGIKKEAQASYDRTMEELGPGLEKAKQVFSNPNH